MQETCQVQERISSGWVKIHLDNLQEKVHNLYPMYSFSKIKKQQIGVSRNGCQMLLQDLGFHKNTIEATREIHQLIELLYHDPSILRLNETQLQHVLYPLLYHKATFRDVVLHDEARIRPLEQLVLLKDPPPVELSDKKDTFSRLEWLAWSLGIRKIIKLQHPFGEFIPPPLIDVRKNLGPALDLMYSNEFQIKSTDLESMIHQRMYFQTRAVEYFDQNAISISSINPRKLHQSHLPNAIYYCFGIQWWKNRADIRHLRSIIWNDGQESIEKYQFRIRFSALACFQVLLKQYAVRLGLEHDQFDKGMLQALLQIQMWGGSPSKYCQGTLTNALNDFDTLSRVTWMYIFVQHEKIVNAVDHETKLQNQMDFVEKKKDVVRTTSIKAVNSIIQRGMMITTTGTS